jgi:hypothetical protein
VAEPVAICRCCRLPVLPTEPKVVLPDGRKTYHESCLLCYECNGPLDPDHFTSFNEGLCCPRCMAEVEVRRCAVCNEPILGRYRRHRGRYWHIEHFQCSQCNCQLKGNNYFVHHNQYFCPNDGAIFKKTCHYCKTEFSGAEPDNVTWKDKAYHSRCFVCRVCGDRCDPENSKCVHRRPYCTKCFDQRVRDNDATPAGRSQSGHEHHPNAINDRRTRFSQMLGRDSVWRPRYKQEGEIQEVEEDDFHQVRNFHGRRVKGRIHKKIRKKRPEHRPPGTMATKRHSYHHRAVQN